MTTIVKRPADWAMSEVFDALESAWPFGTRHAFHVEDFVEEGAYVLRAELPGLDVESDIEVSCTDDLLTITAKREQETHEHHRTEFRYGSFSRTVALPKGADTDAISAKYQRGILEVRVPLTERTSERKIRVDAPAE